LSISDTGIFSKDCEGFTDQSDLDFLVEFLAVSPTDHADAYFGLLNALKELFGRGVDLLEVKAIDNPYLLESINQHRIQLYASGLYRPIRKTAG
jgi:predicted nucleotidyltransferase